MTDLLKYILEVIYLEILSDVILDTIKLIPVLFFAYLLIEYLETKTNSDKLNISLQKYGPIYGGLLGVIPQCGFSVLAASLFLEGKVTLGTLISVLIATSDEAIPVLLAYPKIYSKLLLIIVIKLVLAMLVGMLVDRIFDKRYSQNQIITKEIEENSSILCNASKQTLKITGFIFITNLILGILINSIGQQQLQQILLTDSPIQPILTAIFGFIPNCAISVIMSQLFIDGSLSFASLLAGLITNAGLGLIVLLEYRVDLKIFSKIVLILFGCASVFGLLIEMLF